MDQLTILGFILIIICFIGFYLAYLYGHKTKRFRWSEYIAITIWPLLAILVLAFFINIKILLLFVISSFIGFVLEYLAGLIYHKTLNKKLWEYKRLSLKGYTSLLTIPIWGFMGVLFWFLAKMIGL